MRIDRVTAAELSAAEVAIATPRADKSAAAEGER